MFTNLFLAPSDSPNITEAEFIPDSTIRVTWSTVFFSNGEISNYTIHFVDMFNETRTLTQSGNTVSYNRRRFGQSNFVYVAVQASSPYGNGPTSPFKRISTNGMFNVYYHIANTCKKTLAGEYLEYRQ